MKIYLDASNKALLNSTRELLDLTPDEVIDTAHELMLMGSEPSYSGEVVELSEKAYGQLVEIGARACVPLRTQAFEVACLLLLELVSEGVLTRTDEGLSFDLGAATNDEEASGE